MPPHSRRRLPSQLLTICRTYCMSWTKWGRWRTIMRQLLLLILSIVAYPLLTVDSTRRCNTLNALGAEGVLPMKKRPRINYSARHRALIWERWRKGETLHQIARLFDRYHSSIQRI